MGEASSVLVTGGAGFIGSHLVERLLGMGRRVVVVDNFCDFYDAAIKRRNVELAHGNTNYTLREGDIRDQAFMEDVFAAGRFDCVVHLAAMAGVRPSIEQPRYYNDVNINGTMNVLECCRLFGDRPSGRPRLVFASSSSVYGVNAKVPFHEDDRVEKAISPYAATKLANEVMCHTYHHLYGFPVVCLRFFTVYGPRQRPEMAIAKFIRLIHAGDEVPMFGDGTTRRDYTYFDDIVDGIVASMDAACEYEIINLGNSRTVELRELIGLIASALGKKPRIKQLPLQPGDVPITYADIGKANRLLGYDPGYPIERGIQSAVRWHLDHAHH
ncbi:MAG: SDR family NAD(P)-dependent oxidoreductase [Verrucomicrobia bacterium]|nr:SDR family NAD(P)-dependent oxidoreductase [Verrucomicrobiota bacterium]